MRVTVQDIMALGPCDDYTEERVTELWSGRDGLTIEEIFDLDIPIKDRGWAVLSILAKRHPLRAGKLYRRIALDVAHMWKPPEIVWWWLITGDETSRASARAAARDAVVFTGDSAGAAARDAAVASTWGVWDAARFASDARFAMWAVRAAAKVYTRALDFPRVFAWERYISWAMELMQGHGPF